jgi:14-3-3 protein epsilon
MSNKDDLIFMAKVSEQSERYEDMLETMKKAVALSPELTVDERNLLSVAYKNSISGRRSAWRALESLEKKEESKNNTQHVAQIREYKKKIQTELTSICNDLIDLLDKSLITAASKDDAKVFYYKMKGDYFRYISEVCKGDEYTKAGDNALAAYNLATTTAASLKTTHPIRLGLSLNFSVFYYEVKNNPAKACDIAKTAFDDAIAEIDGIEEDQYKDATTIMQLIRDNLTLWTSELEEEEPKA